MTASGSSFADENATQSDKKYCQDVFSIVFLFFPLPICFIFFLFLVLLKHFFQYQIP